MKTKSHMAQPAVCPRGRTYTARPSVSRTDGKTLICPDCGTREALDSIGVNIEEQDKILDVIHRSQA